MPYVGCKRCNIEFYAKPRHLKRGWGKYCSQKCQFEAQKNGILIGCSECKKLVYRTPRHFKHSKSGNFFCSKSCLAIWKNKHVIFGEQHGKWKHGENAYRNIMLRAKIKPICVDCGIKDFRILLVHHIDRNRKNNVIENLKWLCHNCHHLEHKQDRSRNMVPMV